VSHPVWVTALLLTLDLLLRISLSIRIIMRRLPVGTSLAWLLVVLFAPIVGSIAYLTFGESHVGRGRLKRIVENHRRWQGVASQLAARSGTSRSDCQIEDPRLSTLAEKSFICPILPRNQIQLLENASHCFAAIRADIDASRKSCDLLFYIWAAGGRVDDIADALKRAALRGVQCRLLVDSLGSAAFLKSPAVKELRAAGVEVRAALPTRLISMAFVRPDLRLHRKLVVVDGEVAYTGSLNMADPLTFKQDAGVGQWVDAMVRIKGPTVLAMAASFLSFWATEAESTPSAGDWADDSKPHDRPGRACVQMLASGPAVRVEAIEQVVLTALYSARKDITLTTPYFVPSESLMTALLSIAGSGVPVTLVVPAKVDSRLVYYASQPYLADLLAVGVRVVLFEGGLLHTKSITIDDDLSLFGSLNLDPRSLRLNFELTLAIYDREFNGTLRALQSSYIQQSRPLDLSGVQAQTLPRKLFQNTVRLLGPML
jgi:cardiolipin synthase